MHRSVGVAERLQTNSGVIESGKAVIDFIQVMENVVKQAKHIEAMASI
jgi:hypothetical protein